MTRPALIAAMLACAAAPALADDCRHSASRVLELDLAGATTVMFDVGPHKRGCSVEVGSVGSGDLDVRGVRGNLTVSSKGSGDVRHQGVSGSVDVPRRR